MAAAKPSTLLAVHDLTVSFRTAEGVVSPVRGVSLTIGRGETVALLGESGSGKSVTAQAISGLLPRRQSRVDGGSIWFDGEDLVAAPPHRARELRGAGIAMVFQDPLTSLNPVMRVGYQIGEALRRRRGYSAARARVRVLELMDLVGIPDPLRRIDDFPHQFSGGMRQRVMIALALALEPRLLIADEPTTALDVTIQAQIIDLLERLQRELGMAVLLISHDLGVVADVARRVYVMYAGRIVESGPTRDVYDRPGHPYTDGLLRSLPGEGRSGRLEPIPGNPPRGGSDAPGCAFAPRCHAAIDQCRVERPPLRTPELWPVDRYAACLRTEEVFG